MAELIERYGSSLEKILQGITDLLPDSLQYPETTCARVIFEHNEYVTSNFKTTKWKLTPEERKIAKNIGIWGAHNPNLIIRGESYCSEALVCRSESSSWAGPDGKSREIGFRLVMI